MTPDGIASINALESADALIALVRLTHPAWDAPVRLVQHPTAITHDGEVYDPAPFDLGLPSSEETGQPSLRWEVGNAGQVLIDRLDLPGNAERVRASIRWVLHPRVDIVEFGPCNLYLSGAEFVRETVSGSLSVSHVEELAHGGKRFVPSLFPGLF